MRSLEWYEITIESADIDQWMKVEESAVKAKSYMGLLDIRISEIYLYISYTSPNVLYNVSELEYKTVTYI